MPASPWGPRDAARQDLWLILACAALLAVVLLLVFRPPGGGSATGRGELPPVIGVLSSQTQDVRRRMDGMLVWNAIRRGDVVHDGDGIYVGEGGAATVDINDGARIYIDDKSLIILRPLPKEGRAGGAAMAVDLVQGGASGSTANGPLAIRTGDTALSVEGGSRASLRLLPDHHVAVSVPQGSAELAIPAQPAVPLRGGERRVAAPREGRVGPVERLGPTLLSPPPAAEHFVTTATGAVEFT
ncbi:MAG TPA: FecR domain-containing protein, partial [Myxococcota bacterium]|nr:FecR domain-containing protein [Myxococcota bacterium]